MRPVLIAVLLVTSMIAFPGAHAKALAEDATGDTTTRVFGGPQAPAVPTPGNEAVDLLSLDIAEDPEQLIFTLKVSALPQQMSFARYTIYFGWAKDDFAVVVERQVAEGVIEEETEAWIVNLEEDRWWDRLGFLDHSVDLGQATFVVQVPKAYIIDDRGRYPLLGDEIRDVYVEARGYMSFLNFGVESYDRMPDDGELSYPLQFGDIAKGHVRLDADERVRVSNGGATTFVYRVVVENKGASSDEFDLAFSEMPEGWDGTLQTPLRVPGESERSVAVLVSVPFAHDHGGFSSFNLTATSARDPAAKASIRMGVLHTPIPQPAGHHSELYLHASSFAGGVFSQLFAWTDAFMNTDANHDSDAAEARANVGGGDGFGWEIPLTPLLRMGLDFDVEKTGTITGSILGHTTATGKLRAELILTEAPVEEDNFGREPAEGLLLADSDEIDVTLDVTTPTPFKLTLTPTPDADYIPYVKGQNVVLLLQFEEEGDVPRFCCFSFAEPGLLTADFKMVLPLNEYHDKLSGLSEIADLVELKAAGPVEKIGLPGTTMTYTFDLVNNDKEPLRIDLDLAGTDAALATIVPDASIDLAPKESRRLTLAVAIPTDKNDGEELEVIVFAHAEQDPSKSAIARTKTVVGKTGGEALADESGILLAAQEEANRDTPGLGGIGALVALGAVAFMMRRRS